MKKFYLLLLTASLSMSALAQEKFELGKPGDDNYRYLDEYKALKEYIDYSKYPNFKLGAGTIVLDYLNNDLIKNMINKNFTETVAGNAMKMASCVNGNGDMDFTLVKNYLQAATEAGLNVYGHTLAWHSQQPIGWLTRLIADKPDPNGKTEYTVVASKDFRNDQTIGWKPDNNESTYGFSIKYDNTDGLIVTTTASYPWEVQFVPMNNISLEANKSYKMTFTIKGSEAGKLDGRLGDWNGGTNFTVDFTAEWQDVVIDIMPTMNSNFILVHVPNYIGKVYLKQIKFEGYKGETIPQTAEEKHDTLVYAMDKWISGMMEACDGKCKAWDLVNEAISGGGDDGQGNYVLQSSKQSGSQSWDVGGDKFYWQDYMGDLEYVRQACRLARKYGPEDIKLFINDYNLEGTWDIVTKDGISASKKVWSIVNWIKKWEGDGVTKIDGIGTQMHISFNKNTTSHNALKNAITGMFQVMAKSGKLVRVSEMDMGYNDASGNNVPTSKMTDAQHKEMADFYEWIIKEYFRLIPAAQQWGICQWCPTDSPANSGWRANTPVGIWDLDYYRKHVYAGFVRGLNGGEPTGINKVEAEKVIDTSKGIYDLNGRRLPATSLNDLPSGLYIVNGKKMVK
jgi:GH35 family endo-1,4-beta-xylanase